MHHLETPLLTDLALVFNWLGRGLGRAITLALVGVLLLRRLRRLALVAFAVAEGVTPLLSTLLKAMTDRSRPPDGLVHAAGASFPSGHAAYAGATCVALVLLFTTPGARRGWWWGLAASASSSWPGVGRTCKSTGSRTSSPAHFSAPALRFSCSPSHSDTSLRLSRGRVRASSAPDPPAFRRRARPDPDRQPPHAPTPVRRGRASPCSSSRVGSATCRYVAGIASCPSEKNSTSAAARSSPCRARSTPTPLSACRRSDVACTRRASSSARRKVLASLVEAPERRGREAEPAEGGRHAPAVVRVLERPRTRERVLQRLLVLAEAVGAHAGTALRVARPGVVACSGEELAGLEVQVDRRRVVTLGIRQQPELADREAEHQGPAELRRDLVTLLEGLRAPARSSRQKTHETEPGKGSPRRRGDRRPTGRRRLPLRG